MSCCCRNKNLDQTIRTNAKKLEDKRKDELAKLTADMNGAVERFDAETFASGLDQGALLEQCTSLVTKFCVLTTTTGVSSRSTDQRRYSRSSIASTPDAETAPSLPQTIYLQPEVKAEDLYRLLVDKFIILITANSSSSSSTSLFLSKVTSASTTALGHQQRVTGGPAFSSSRSNLVAIHSVSQMGSGVQSPLARPNAVSQSSRNLNMNMNFSPANSRPSSGTSSANNSQHNSVALRSATKASPLDAAHRISLTPSTSSVSIEGSTHISHLATPNLVQRSAANSSGLGQLLTTANPAFRTGSNPSNLNNLNRSGQPATGSAVTTATTSNSIASNHSTGANPAMMSVSLYMASTSASASGGATPHNAVTATASSPAMRPATGASQLPQPGSVRFAHQSSKQTTILPSAMSAMGNVRGSGSGSSTSYAAARTKGSSREQLDSKQQEGNGSSNNKPSPGTAAEATCL